MLLQQQQQQHQPQQDPRQQKKQPRSSNLSKSTLLNRTSNSNLLINNTVNNITNTQTPTTTTTTTTTTTATPTTTTTFKNKARLDSRPSIIQIDSLNNNNNNNSNNNNGHSSLFRTNLDTTTTTTPTPTPTTTASNTTTTTRIANTEATLNNNGIASTTTHSSPDDDTASAKPPKRRSLLNFKSLDLHLKSFYSGLRSGHQKAAHSQASSLGGSRGVGLDNANGSDLIAIDTPSSRCPSSAAHSRMPPYLKIESVDCEESANLLLDYPQSPYSSRRNSSQDDNRSSSQLLHISRYEVARSQTSSPSPSPYYLSPYAMDSSGNMRRSSTSDITSCRRSATSSGRDSRRPSTSELLRKARERRGSEARMGRSVSHGGLPRGGGGAYRGGRRTSMAF